MSRPRTIRWGILGLGRAGRARSRAIADDPRCEWVAVHRGRYVDEAPPEIRRSGPEQVFGHSDAVVIASPDATHPALVQAALHAGCHVVCEYPLAPDADLAQGLFELAYQQDLCLHVSHIELLHQPQHRLKEEVLHDPGVRIEQAFHRRQVQPPTETWAHGQVARLHRLVDLAGPIEAIEELRWSPVRVTGTLRHHSGALSCIDWTQGPDRPRQTTQTLVTRNGVTWKMDRQSLSRDGVVQPAADHPPLFHRDHACAMSRIVTGSPGYLTTEQILHVLSWVHRLENRAGPKSKHLGQMR